MSTLALDSRNRRAWGLAGRGRLLACLIAAVVTVTLSVARAADAATFPFVESFRTTTAPAFALGGNPGSPAVLTAGAGDPASAGWLRLTPAANNRFGYAYHRTAFPSGDGLTFEFDYAAWGGAGSGADGLAFVLFDGATTDAAFHPGPAGGSLGYTPCNADPGLSNAYMAVGLDSFGNFANRENCGQSGDGYGIVPHRISIRGGIPDFQHLRSVIATQGVSASRTDARRVTVTVLPKDGATTVTAQIHYPDGTVQPIATDLALPSPPPTLKFGFTASTGGSVNNHEIRDLRVTKPTDLRVAAAPEPTSTDRNGVQEYVARITNAGPNDATGVDVTASAPYTTDVAWTCTAAGGATCTTSSGTGFPQGDVGPLPADGELTFRITSRLTDDADDSSLRFSADPTGGTSELTPADNVVEARTDVTPGLEAAPTLTLSPGGLATATSHRAFGGSPTRVLRWLRCTAAGDDCHEIAGALGATYATTDADRGGSLRVRETVTNSAGSATAVSFALPVPPTASVPDTDPDANPVPVNEPPLAALPLPPMVGVPPFPPPVTGGGTVVPPADPPVDPSDGDAGGDGEPAAGATAGSPPPAALGSDPVGPASVPTVTGPLGVPSSLVPFGVPEPPASAPRPTSSDPASTPTTPTTRTFVIARGVASGAVRRKLSRLLPLLRRATAVRCVGFTDNQGSAASNERLGQRRAAAACRTLRRMGLRATLSASSRGQEQPRASNKTAAGREKNHRVELVVRFP